MTCWPRLTPPLNASWLTGTDMPRNLYGRAGFRAGPVCRVCRKDRADRDQEVCVPCTVLFRQVDLIAASPAAIRQDMVDAGLMAQEREQ